MVKPGGTGRPRLAISARLAPLPPKRSRMLALPSALPSPKVNTHLPDFTASDTDLDAGAFLTAAALPAVLAAGLAEALAAGLAEALATGLVTALAAGFAAALAGAFFNALRAATGAALADGFDFAATFLDFATALAMSDNNPNEGESGVLT